MIFCIFRLMEQFHGVNATRGSHFASKQIRCCSLGFEVVRSAYKKHLAMVFKEECK